MWSGSTLSPRSTQKKWLCLQIQVWATSPQPPNKKRNRRYVTWFNPSFDCNVKTKTCAKFLRLIDKHFPKGHPLRPLINRDTGKIGYRCLPSMAKAISNHSNKVLNNNQPTQNPQEKLCNCKQKEDCPMGGESMFETRVIISSNCKTEGEDAQNYVGTTASSIKERYSVKLQSWRIKRHNIERLYLAAQKRREEIWTRKTVHTTQWTKKKT